MEAAETQSKTHEIFLSFLCQQKSYLGNPRGKWISSRGQNKFLLRPKT